jgi:uncharacterized protein YgbK (DUF1537 family)
MNDRLFCYYGDDFTGSTDALEALAANGVPSVLFLDPPGEEALRAFPGCRAIGVAGESRSRSPEWMSAHLPQIFESLKQYDAPICQYKVCSTFDSSPGTGSIGRALEIGQQVFRSTYVPVIVAAPHLKRYVLFGNLFAAGGGAVHRIDRHPTMGHHPVTPMDEGDLRLHLGRQTSQPLASLDLLALRNGCAEPELEKLVAQGSKAVIFDGLDEQTLAEIGRLLWSRSAAAPFAIGSSGLTHALIRHWRAAGMIPGTFKLETPNEVDRLIVVSGSCSPVTEAQIRFAMNHGFRCIRIEDPDVTREQAQAALDAGESVIVYSALGPQDCSSGPRGEERGATIGVLLRELIVRSGVRRAVVAGGDTSTHAVRRLGIQALTFLGLTTPGAPLCRAHADGAMDGIELVLKGGQVGPEDYFELARRGRQL